MQAGLGSTHSRRCILLCVVHRSISGLLGRFHGRSHECPVAENGCEIVLDGFLTAFGFQPALALSALPQLVRASPTAHIPTPVDLEGSRKRKRALPAVHALGVRRCGALSDVPTLTDPLGESLGAAAALNALAFRHPKLTRSMSTHR